MLNTIPFFTSIGVSSSNNNKSDATKIAAIVENDVITMLNGAICGSDRKVA